MILLIASLLFSTPVLSREITIGSKKFTEANILAYVIAHTVKEINSEQKVRVIENLGGTGVVTTAAQSHEIDLYVDYTATLYETFKTTKENLPFELKKNNLVLGFKLGFDNSYGLATLKDTNIFKISDIKNDHKFGISHEFYKRDDGFYGLADHYNFNIKPEVIEFSLLLHSLIEKKLDIIEIFTTDAKIKKYDLRVLSDDKKYYKRYDAILVFNQSFYLKNNHLIKELIQKLKGKINNQTIQELNYNVDILKMTYEESARTFTKSKTVIKSAYQNSFWPHLFEHIEYLMITVLICSLIGIPLGVLTANSLMAQRVILSFISITQTIPSLALLVFLIPLFGLGKLTTIIALCLYGLLPIVKNTHTGLKKIPKELLEYSDIIGMSKSQRILMIELPLAKVDIISGIKLTSIYTIGVTVIAAFIGAGGLGTLIVTGLTLNDTDLILQGAIPSAILAIIIEVIFQKVIPLFYSKGSVV